MLALVGFVLAEGLSFVILRKKNPVESKMTDYNGRLTVCIM